MIFDIWHDCIIAGKHSKKFKKYAATKSKVLRPSKYDPNCVIDSGSVSLEDARFLSDIVQKHRPKVIVEIGTWFGTSAYAMAFAMRVADIYGHIFTCDTKDLFMPGLCTRDGRLLENVYYKNLKSTKMLKQMLKIGIKIDFVFCDGQVSPKDWRLIMKLFGDNPMFVATHDRDLKKGKTVKSYFVNTVRSIYEVMVDPDTAIWCGREKIVDKKQ